MAMSGSYGLFDMVIFIATIPPANIDPVLIEYGLLESPPVGRFPTTHSDQFDYIPEGVCIYIYIVHMQKRGGARGEKKLLTSRTNKYSRIWNKKLLRSFPSCLHSDHIPTPSAQLPTSLASRATSRRVGHFGHAVASAQQQAGGLNGGKRNGCWNGKKLENHRKSLGK